MPKTIYLAGPDVFLRDAYEIGERKKALCRKYGFGGKFPYDVRESGRKEPDEIYRQNRRSMQRLGIGLFNLSPFRGPSADAGTLFELGYMLARGKRVFGYSSSERTYEERVIAAKFGPLQKKAGRFWDRQCFRVEDSGFGDNLMIYEGIQQSGGFVEVYEEKTSSPSEKLAAFGAFELCLQRLSTMQRSRRL
jgi:nucleoside 2-deoxyribosyltransferase